MTAPEHNVGDIPLTEAATPLDHALFVLLMRGLVDGIPDITSTTRARFLGSASDRLMNAVDDIAVYLADRFGVAFRVAIEVGDETLLLIVEPKEA